MVNSALPMPAESPTSTPLTAPFAVAPSRPELLAPAGDWECAKAAVENGADAIYFGLERFNARMRAHNFTEADLPKLMEFLHRRGVRGYVTFNTLVFANELADAEQYLRAIIAAGVDAAIVQDVGVARLIRRLSPDFPIHASTQMSITSAAGVRFARELGCNLVVLARECSIKDIEAIHAEVKGAKEELRAESNAPSHFPLEVFVHGALCVAYSGQCLTSESLGGRSANRGECAQACRMPYELVSDGQNVPLGDRKYLLSPQDLAGLDVLPELVRSGVASLKIEGRLKTPEYVANITRVYRRALDDLRFTNDDLRFAGKTPAPPETPDARQSSFANRKSFSASDDQYALEMAFSRGLYTGWFRGINNQELVHARFGKKRGVFLGEVTRVERERVRLTLQAPLKAGDGVVFDNGHPEQEEEGGRVFAVHQRTPGIAAEEVALTFMPDAVNFSRVHVGDKVWKTSDPELDRRLRQTFAGEQPQFLRPIALEIHGHADAPLTVLARDEQGHVAQAASTMPLVAAQNRPLTTEKLREQLGRLGGSVFQLGELTNRLEGEVMLPVSELNRLRRDVVAALDAQRAAPKRWQLVEGRETRVESRADVRSADAELIVLVRSLPQLETTLRCGVTTIYCEFEDPKKYREAVTLFHTAPGCAAVPSQHGPPSIWVAPPRITKPGEEWILKQVRSCNADGYLVRNYDHLEFFADTRQRGDFSLNIANALAAEHFLTRHKLEQLTASYDLDAMQIAALLRTAPPAWFEITIHQHMPMFHMEHCVFCAFLSSGTDFRNCGRPCDVHDVKLRDRVGMEHPLKADAGCRNTLFNAKAQTGAEHVAQFIELGARKFRLEFLNETAEEVTQTISMYRRLLRGEVTGAELWRELKLRNQLGVTRGTLQGAGS
jgi:putative protease